MKRTFQLLAIAALMITVVTTKTFAQDSTKLQINAGLMFAPQAGLNLNHPEKGFSAFAPLFATVTFIKGNSFVTPFYSLSSNSVGIAAEHVVFAKKVNMYVVGTKNVLEKGGYAGIGVDTPVAGGLGSAFVEFGSLWNEWNPECYIGVFIPLMFKVK